MQIRIDVLDHRAMATAMDIHAVLLRAQAQEAGQLAREYRISAELTVGEIQASNDWYLGALIDGTLTGALSVGPDDEPDQIRVMLLFVDPQYQRRGIARRLMIEVIKRNAGAVMSVITTAANAPALALYSDLGFQPYRRGSMGPSQLELIKLRFRPV